MNRRGFFKGIAGVGLVRFVSREVIAEPAGIYLKYDVRLIPDRGSPAQWVTCTTEAQMRVAGLTWVDAD